MVRTFVLALVVAGGCGHGDPAEECASERAAIERAAANSTSCDADADCVALQSFEYDEAGLCGFVVNQSAKPGLDAMLAAWAAKRCDDDPSGTCPTQPVSVQCANGVCACAAGMCE